MTHTPTFRRYAADDLENLIGQAEHLYQNDEPHAGQHYLVLMALHEVDFRRRRFGPRFADGLYRPTTEVKP